MSETVVKKTLVELFPELQHIAQDSKAKDFQKNLAERSISNYREAV
jgi:hypothetical protein